MAIREPPEPGANDGDVGDELWDWEDDMETKMSLSKKTTAALIEISDEHYIAHGLRFSVIVTPPKETTKAEADMTKLILAGFDPDPADIADEYEFHPPESAAAAEIGSAAMVEFIENGLAKHHAVTLHFSNETDGEACLHWLCDSGARAVEDMADFSWDEIYARRRRIAKVIQTRLGLSFALTVEEPFDGREISDQFIADQPMWKVPFYAIGARMKEMTDHTHVIDHAFWLLSGDRESEPWGFVTEPYVDEAEAVDLARRLNAEVEEWGIEIQALPTAQSAWFPNSTVAIVTFAHPNYLPAFLKHGVAAALERLPEGHGDAEVA